jgi:hypothetical protein
MTDPERVPAVGGTRLVRAPDAVARDYLLLALRLEQHIPGLVDGYFGPADLKAQVDVEPLRSPARLRDDASELVGRLAGDVSDSTRRGWLEVQLIALETQAAALAGEALPYLDHVERCFAFRPQRHEDVLFETAATELADLLPGDAPLAERLAVWDADLEVPADRLAAVVGWLVERFRSAAASRFGLPAGEDLRVQLVTDQPWGAYNWYDGGRRSRVDVNTDLPSRAPGLIGLVAHEAFPGHHLEHAWKETELVDRLGRLESSILLINTPECLISEGLADLGIRFASPVSERAALLVELFERAGLSIATDPVASREAAELAVALARPRAVLGSIGGDAAILRHDEGRSHDEVLTYMIDVGRYAPAQAVKRLGFIEHPLWRTYVFVYAEGEALLRRWLEVVPEAEQVARFGRLLREQMTPADVTVPD